MTNDAPPPLPGDPFPCPECGHTDAWKADYYEAVWQDVTVLTGNRGEPDIVDYTGVYGSYDDGSTENESLRCRNCDHEIVLGRFRFLPAEDTSPEDAETSRDIEHLLAGLEVGSVAELRELVEVARAARGPVL